MDTKENIKKILNCYSDIIAVNKDAIKGWKINQHVVSQNPYVKIGITEPVFDEEKSDSDAADGAGSKHETLTDLGELADNFVNINSLDCTNMQTDENGNVYSLKHSSDGDVRQYYLKTGGAVSVSITSAASDPSARIDVTQVDAWKDVKYDGIPHYEDEREDESADTDEKEYDDTRANIDYTQYYKKTQEQFKEELLGARLVFYHKLKDYGASWRIMRPESLTDQIFIKAKRIRSIETKGVSLIDEGIRSELIGIVNYGIIALIQLEYGFSDTVDKDAEWAQKEYDKYANAALELMKKKNHDYDEAWRGMRTTSYTDLILTKINRTKEIESHNGKTVVSEGIDANYMDMINYAVFGLIKIMEQSNS